MGHPYHLDRSRTPQKKARDWGLKILKLGRELSLPQPTVEDWFFSNRGCGEQMCFLMCFFDLQMKLYKNDVYPKHEKKESSFVTNGYLPQKCHKNLAETSWILRQAHVGLPFWNHI